MRWVLEDRKGLLIGALLGLVISAILYAWVNHQPGTLIELPPLQQIHFPA